MQLIDELDGASEISSASLDISREIRIGVRVSGVDLSISRDNTRPLEERDLAIHGILEAERNAHLDYVTTNHVIEWSPFNHPNSPLRLNLRLISSEKTLDKCHLPFYPGVVDGSANCHQPELYNLGVHRGPGRSSTDIPQSLLFIH